MLELAWQTVRRQPGRYVAAMGGVAAAVMLVFIASGLYLGLVDAMIRYPRSLPGEIVVAEAGGSATMLHSSSHLAQDRSRACTTTSHSSGISLLPARIAAIWHGLWTLIEADGVRGRYMTSWPSLRTDLRNAGADVVDQEAVVDGNLVTSRKPDDIPAFNREMIKLFAGTRGQRETA